MYQLSDVINVIDLIVGSSDHPLAVSVASEVWCNNVIVLSIVLSHPVPIAAVISSAVYEKHGWLLGVTPVDIVQPQPL